MFKNYLRNIFNRELSADIKVQFIRFIINGIISAVGDISVLYILTDYFGIYYLISAAIGFIVGTTINYYISIIWVFEKGKIKKQLLEYALFVISSVIGLTINIFVMFVGVSIFYR